MYKYLTNRCFQSTFLAFKLGDIHTDINDIFTCTLNIDMQLESAIDGKK